ncbi:hypothetical protein AUJ17_05720 [Candidatus Micrarchaeota archaeon CG1_02_47_40]|nr:MAG: hypothetical protein AUJ17_05720 [Candidatus Micrarchaeota archaeon CG1_02_47_40]
MADTKMKALMAIARLVIAAIAGGMVGYLLDQSEWPMDIVVGGGIISFVMVFLLLTKLNKSGD